MRQGKSLPTKQRPTMRSRCTPITWSIFRRKVKLKSTKKTPKRSLKKRRTSKRRRAKTRTRTRARARARKRGLQHYVSSALARTRARMRTRTRARMRAKMRAKMRTRTRMKSCQRIKTKTSTIQCGAWEPWQSRGYRIPCPRGLVCPIFQGGLGQSRKKRMSPRP